MRRRCAIIIIVCFGLSCLSLSARSFQILSRSRSRRPRHDDRRQSGCRRSPLQQLVHASGGGDDDDKPTTSREEEIANLEEQLRLLKREQQEAEDDDNKSEAEQGQEAEELIASAAETNAAPSSSPAPPPDDIMDKVPGKDMILSEGELLDGDILVDSNDDGNDGGGLGGAITTALAGVALVVGLILFAQVPVGQEDLARYSASGSAATTAKTIDLGDLNTDAKVRNINLP